MVRIIDTDAMVAQVVATVRRRFAGFVDRDDLHSEAILWMLEHQRLMDEYLSDEDIKRAGYRLRRDLTWCLERYARRERAEQLGYDPEDEAFYRAVQVAAALPSVVLGTYDPPLADLEAVRALQDPAEGGTWMAVRADVAQAWERVNLSDEDREIMSAYYVQGFTLAEIGEALGMDPGTVSKRLKRSMRRMVTELGGEKPKGCPYDCQCHDAPLRVRPSMRSSQSGLNQVFE